MDHLAHQHIFNIHNNSVFDNVIDYDSLNSAIYEYGKSEGEVGSDEYNEGVGMAFEVYAEFFCKLYGSTPKLGISKITDTSDDPFNEGYDFDYADGNDQHGLIQVKWKHNPQSKFSRKDLGTFSSVLHDEELTREHSILFVNIRHLPNKDKGSVFHFGWDQKARKQMRVIDRSTQEEYILRDVNFWNELRTEIKQAVESRHLIVEPIPTNRPHQDVMEQGTLRVLDLEIPRGRVICATGGGKTLIEYRNVEACHFDKKGEITIVVAPTRDLVDQHFETFHNYGLFHKGIFAVNFKSGSEPKRDDDGMDFEQTTSEQQLGHLIDTNDHIHICSTYASFPVLIDCLNAKGITADLIIFDEFQHIVSQKANEMGQSDIRSFLIDLPSKRVLFYSASQKRGRILSSFDEEVFGPILANISYKELRETGILVPKLKLIPILINPSRIKGLSSSMKETMKIHEDLDPRAAIIEAAGLIVAYQHASINNPDVNMITWGKKITHLEAIHSNDAVQEHLPNVDLHLIHARIATRNRNNVYQKVKSSANNVILQHSCVSEGVNVVNLDTGYVARRLSQITMQQGPCGRPTRADPIDRKNFAAGNLTIDDPSGWKKYSATIYILVETKEDETYKDYMVELIRKLQFAGLTEDDYEFHDLIEERVGTSEGNDDGETKPDLSCLDFLSEESLDDVISKATLEIEESERDVEESEKDEEMKKMSKEDFWKEIFGEA